ncbi:hypothetical protein RYX36_024439, partial [Vicia faba]
MEKSFISLEVFSFLDNFKPQAFNDLKRSGNWWSFVLSIGISKEGDTKPASALNVISKNPLKDEIPLFMIFLMNITTNKRIWTALHMDGNSKLIHKISCDGDVIEESPFALNDDETYPSLLSQLNDSQKKNAIRACLSSFHCSKSTVDLISGPPGSGKTKTLATLLFPLLKMNRRTLVSAPTSVAIKEVASRVLSIVRESYHDGDALMCNFGDMLLFGNHDRLNVGADIQEIYLDYRASKLLQCFNALSGWKQCFLSMIDLLENFVSHYYMFIENPMRKEQAHFEPKSFLKFLEERFFVHSKSLHKPLHPPATFLHPPISLQSLPQILCNLAIFIASSFFILDLQKPPSGRLSGQLEYVRQFSAVERHESVLPLLHASEKKKNGEIDFLMAEFADVSQRGSARVSQRVTPKKLGTFGSSEGAASTSGIASQTASGVLSGSGVLNARPGSATSSGLLSHMVSSLNAEVAKEYLEKVADLLLEFAQADKTVKFYICSQSLLSRLFQMFNRVEPPILLKILKCINHLSTDPNCLENLQRAEAIKYLIPNLELKEGSLVSEIHHEVLNALFNLCKINKRKQLM